MSTITTRAGKGSPLTNAEVDANFENLNTDKLEASDIANLVSEGSDATFSSVQLTGGTGTQGTISWNTDEETLDVILDGATLQMGQEIHYHARNNTGSTIPDGTAVYATGTLGASGRITIAPFIANGTIPAKYFLGITTEDIANGTDGKVTHFGKIRGVDTSAFTEGAVLYPSATTAGALTSTAPTGSNIALPVAFVIYAAANGTLFTRATNLDENAFATAAQGALADSALQSGDNVSTLTNDAGYATTSYVDTAESDAVATAAADATSKANAALASANSYTDTAVAGLVDTAPATLDTLNELAAALGDDPNFATTVSTQIGTKQDAATALTTSTTFGGDVSGTYNAIVVADDSHNHIIANVDGLQAALDGKVDDSQVLTNVPLGAVFTDTTYSVGNGGLTEINFTSALNSKLAGIEAGATGDQTAAEILAAIKTVDGAGSGLDADLLDGQSSAYYATATHNHTLDSLSNTTITSNTSGEILKWNGTAWVNNTLAEAGIQPAGSYLTGNQTITLSGDASGSGTTSIAVTVNNDSHSHSTSTITGLGALATLSSVGAAQITDNSVGAAELNVSGNGTAGQALLSDGDGTMTWGSVGSFPSGTAMLFQQTSAPTGWTKSTTHNDKALRVVSGTVTTGGTTAFSTAMGTPSVSGTVGISGAPAVGTLAVSMSGNVTVGNTTLSVNTIPSHSHAQYAGDGTFGNAGWARYPGTTAYRSSSTGSTGNNGAHGHSASHNLSGVLNGAPSVGNLAGSLSSATAAINVQYVDIIIATKD